MIAQAADVGVPWLLFVLIGAFVVIALPIGLLIYALVSKSTPGMRANDPLRGFEVGPADDSAAKR